jgi:hypothetical protein
MAPGTATTTTAGPKVEEYLPPFPPFSFTSLESGFSSLLTQLVVCAAQNLSFVLEGVDKVMFEDRPMPEIRDAHDVLVQVKYTGICGSDVRKLKP